MNSAAFAFLQGETPGRTLGEMPDNTTTNTPAATPSADPTPAAGNAPAKFQKWDDFLAAQAPEVQALYDGHIDGLRNTVKATRDERDAVTKRLEAISKKLGQDPDEAKRMLDEMSKQADAANRRADFMDEAIKPEIGCSNPRLAFTVAQADGLFTRQGAPDWSAIKAAAPELFRKPNPTPPVHAGNGAGQEPTASKTMNSFIRRAAGREQ